MSKIFFYLSTVAVPVIILLIIIYALLEKKKVFDLFIKGATEGLQIVLRIFPTLIGIFLAVGFLRTSGIIDLITKMICPITYILKVPSEVIPLMLIRPISGSASVAVATDIMKVVGVDSNIGLIASTIMGSTETTFYTIAIYTSAVGIKKTRFVLAAALIADVVGMLASVVFCSLMS